MSKVNEKHRELASAAFWSDYNADSTDRDTAIAVAQAIADAEARGREAGIREAADVAANASAEWWAQHQRQHYSEDEHWSDAADALTDRILALLPEVTK